MQQRSGFARRQQNIYFIAAVSAAVLERGCYLFADNLPDLLDEHVESIVIAVGHLLSEFLPGNSVGDSTAIST